MESTRNVLVRLCFMPLNCDTVGYSAAPKTSCALPPMLTSEGICGKRGRKKKKNTLIGSLEEQCSDRAGSQRKQPLNPIRTAIAFGSETSKGLRAVDPFDSPFANRFVVKDIPLLMLLPKKSQPGKHKHVMSVFSHLRVETKSQAPLQRSIQKA